MRAIIFGGLILLSGCGQKEERGSGSLNPSLPGIVVGQLPLGVSLDSVQRDVNGCFFYTQNGAVFVVNDDFGMPICQS